MQRGLAAAFPGQPPAEIRLAADPPGLERSEDAGSSWSRLPPAAFEPEGGLTVIQAPAYHPDTAYVASASGEIWASADRGRTWSRIKRDLPPVMALAIGRIL